MTGIFATLNLEDLESKTTLTPRSGFTRSGFGRRLATRHMVKYQGRWRRVYCCIFSNSGTCYIDAPTRAFGEANKRARDWIVIR